MLGANLAKITCSFLDEGWTWTKIHKTLFGLRAGTQNGFITKFKIYFSITTIVFLL